MDQEVACFRRPLAVSGGIQHAGQLPHQRDLQAVSVWIQTDALDELPDGLDGAGAAGLVLERFGHLRDPVAIDVGHARVQELREFGHVGLGREFLSAGLECQQFALDGQRWQPFLDRANQLLNLPLDDGQRILGLGQLCPVLHAQPIQLAHVLAAELLEQVTAHQLVPQGREHTLLQFLPADRPSVGASPAGTS
ncbi:MAG TPA: hypothetical protein VMF13_16485 [Luteitalea sp.]|nr:hypothetical protein [Luteitalea sp.]